MKLTDFCVLFAALFICLFLGRDLYIGSLLAQRTTQVIYDRQMDRIAEDALMDVVETEADDCMPLVRTSRLQEQYERLMGLAFDLADDEMRLRAWESVTLWQFTQHPYALSAQELDTLRSQMEAEICAAKSRRREEQHLSIAFPYTSGEAWYQTVSGTQLLTVFDPREPLAGYDRALISGSRIEKLAAAAGLQAQQLQLGIVK